MPTSSPELQRLLRSSLTGFDEAVVDQEEGGGEDADSGDNVPGLGGVVFDLGVVVHDAAAEPADDEGADAEWEEGGSMLRSE